MKFIAVAYIANEVVSGRISINRISHEVPDVRFGGRRLEGPIRQLTVQGHSSPAFGVNQVPLRERPNAS